MQDFRTVKDSVKKVVAQLREEDPNWSWRADVLKSEIRVWWGYLQYIGTKDSHFTIKMEEESSTDDFMIATNENDEFMTGAFIGDKSWCDGEFNACVERLLRGIASIAHNTY